MNNTNDSFGEHVNLASASGSFKVFDLNTAPKELHFNCEPGVWCMKLTNKGIFFNREAYPDLTPDDFALKVVDILEKKFTVNFENRKE